MICFRPLALLAITVVLAAGCASFQPASPDAKTGRFPTNTEVSQRDILACRPLSDITDVKFLYARVHYPGQPDKFQFFFKDSLTKIGFKSVLNEQELARFIIQSNLLEHLSNISDLVALNRLSKAIGPFLVLNANLTRIGDAHFKFDLEIIDPRSTEILLKVSRSRTAWVDFDAEVMYPMMNVIKSWYDNSEKLKARGSTVADDDMIDQYYPGNTYVSCCFRWGRDLP